MKKSARVLLLISLLLVLPVFLSACAKDLAADGQRELPGLVILIDPGHGDTDVGTIGALTGCYEKDINLTIALKLKTALEEKGVTVRMTRADDAPLGPADEGDIAQRKENDMQARENIIAEAGANLLVSIHQNAFEDPEVRGPQVFFLKYNDKSYGVEFAQAIQDALNAQILQEMPRDISYGNWRLLKQGSQPGCIVECGFLSNPEEELLLLDDAYQDKLVMAITAGIEAYVKQYGA